MPQVLIASASPYESRLLEAALEPNGWRLLHVRDAKEAARRLDGAAHASVLVIDSGLLEMPHDGQWRQLRALHPELGVVVRCLAVRDRALKRGGSTTWLVDPDDVEGMCRALRAIRGLGSTAAPAPPPGAPPKVAAG